MPSIFFVRSASGADVLDSVGERHMVVDDTAKFVVEVHALLTEGRGPGSKRTVASLCTEQSRYI